MTQPAARDVETPFDLDDAIDHLRDEGGRLTPSRRALLEHLHGADRRHTADELTDAFPDVDPATIYRSLAQFEQAGIIDHVHVGHGPSSYAWAGRRAVVVACAMCGATADVPIERFAELDDALDREYGFRLELGHFALSATCAACRHRASTHDH